ncbi:MAG: hypothetical protein J2P47_03095, partial [Acetobacteraceae bacterium]|nr:hypothetical protein [Acetobacteraceae bacterium]
MNIVPRGRLDPLPDREIGHGGTGRNVVAEDGNLACLDLRALQEIADQLLRRALVFGERPNAPEI